ncbi:MAG: Wzz/FepE/Etk N-terminal domain-containing protein [Clostridia bacterium]|nr:Wzz/FepE/Etk N-terminal domain-containing protein [Clostridia bacterium]MDY5554498.1 Wzz/FepE/Etk N-terminal domain-containing protein [Blautia sp.]
MTKNIKENQEQFVSVSATHQPEEDVIDLMELFRVLISRWKMILIALMAGAVLFGFYHGFLLKPSYQADASIFITNNNSMITVSDLQLSSELTADYAKIIKSRTVLKQVIKELDLDMDFRQLDKLVEVTNPQDSHIITISVTCGDIELCRNIANSLMNTGIDRIYQVIGSSEPTVIDYSEAEAVEEVTPGLAHYLLLGGLIGAVLACALVILRYMTDTTLKTEDDIQKYLHMPVLAVVPYYEEKKD